MHARKFSSVFLFSITIQDFLKKCKKKGISGQFSEPSAYRAVITDGALIIHKKRNISGNMCLV